jgi:hypothetical protein
MLVLLVLMLMLMALLLPALLLSWCPWPPRTHRLCPSLLMRAPRH